MSEEQERDTTQSGPSRRYSGGGRGGGFRQQGGRRSFKRRVKRCAFCADKSLEIDYKQPDVLWRYLSDRGKIRPRRQTGACARHQRQLALAIKRARHLAFLPFVVDHPRTG